MSVPNSLPATTLALHTRHWPVSEPSGAGVLLVHGLAEHCGRYEEVAATLNAAGYPVWALDLPGHGHSAGRRGHVECFQNYIDAVAELRGQVAASHPQLPVVLLGHSMGGLIAASTLLQAADQYAGCVLSGAALQSPLQPGWLQMTVIRILSRLAPTLGVLQLDADGVSRDPVVVQNYRDDPLVYDGKVSARLVRQLFAAMQGVRDNAAAIEAPLLILHGEADAMTAAEGSRWLQQAVAASDKSLHIYPGLYHEIFNEPERKQVYADVVAWLQQRWPTPRWAGDTGP